LSSCDIPVEHTVFIGGLTDNASVADLRAIFGPPRFPSFLAARIPTHEATGLPKGCAYVFYAALEDAQRAIAGMGGFVLSGGRLSVVMANPKSVRNNNSAQQVLLPPATLPGLELDSVSGADMQGDPAYSGVGPGAGLGPGLGHYHPSYGPGLGHYQYHPSYGPRYDGPGPGLGQYPGPPYYDPGYAPIHDSSGTGHYPGPPYYNPGYARSHDDIGPGPNCGSSHYPAPSYFGGLDVSGDRAMTYGE
jgi:RNA recognition motif-containing protein